MKWSSLGSGAAVLCAVHCLALPVLAGAASVAHSHPHATPWENPWIESGMLGLTAVIGYGTLGAGFRRHGQALPLVLLTLGLALLFGAHHLISGGASSVATLLGALCAVGAQVANGRCPSSGCTVSGCTGHRTEVEPQPAGSRI